MTESLGDLLRRSAEAAPEPRLDVGELVAHAGRRQRRRRLAVVASTTALVGAIVVGSFAVRGGQPRDLEPAPSRPPSDVYPPPPAARPLVYADGATVHVGEDTFDAGGTVSFLDATDDGVVFVTEESGRGWFNDLWFNDGSSTEAIGRVSTQHVGMFAVWTANPGSLVVWSDPTSGTLVAYDTSEHEVVGLPPTVARGSRADRLPFVDLPYVDENEIFFPADGTHVLRYDLASGTTDRVSQAAFEAELRGHARLLVFDGERGDSGTAFADSVSARFDQVGRRLVPVDFQHPDLASGVTDLTLTTGESVRLRLPAGYVAPLREQGQIRVVQWLDDHRLVLFANEANHDSLPEVGDLLECRLPDGTCRVAVRAGSTPYVAPGTK